MNIQCQVCRQTFLQTTKAPAYVIPHPYPLRILLFLLLYLHIESLLTYIRGYSLLEHASNKHNKGLPECFPGISA
jgi:hypothetical protein